jgi:hypothetical protein
LPWQGQPQRARQLLDRATRFDPDLRFNWRNYIIDFFLGHFRDTVEVTDGLTERGRWDDLYATLAQAQLGDASATALWRTRLSTSWPDYSWEFAASEAGDFSPLATAERALWRDSHLKAQLPLCATAEQVVRLTIEPMPECDAERAKLAASRT